MNCKECVHYKLCRDLFCQVDTLTDDDKKCDYYEPTRPHGEWEHWGSPFSDDTIANSIVCTRCKARYVEIDGEVFNFCPNCGADMREGEAE